MMFFFEGIPALVSLAVLVLILVRLHRQQYSGPFLVCFTVFWVYILLLIDKTLFPVEFNREMAIQLQADGISQLTRSNFVPFFFGPFATRESITDAVSQNILLTVPFGFLICFIARIRVKDLLWLPVGVGIGIESCQFLVSQLVGYPYRVIDINDFIMNAVGVLAGYLLFRAFASIYLAATTKSRFSPKSFWGYLRKIAIRR